MKNIQRFLQRAYHFMERIERESKYFPRRLHIFGWNVAVKTFFDGLVPPGKREFYIQAIENYVDEFLKEFNNEFCQNMLTRESYQENIIEKFPIWCCWWQGEETMPELVKMCHTRLKQVIPKEKAELHLITLDNYKSYVDIPEHIIQKFEKGIITMTTMSDVLRFHLLERYGGYWLDATVFFSDEIPKEYFSGKFFCQRMSKDVSRNRREACKGNWCGFSMAGPKGCVVFKYMKEAFSKWWQEYDTIIDYVLIDYLLLSGYKHVPTITKIINQVPDNNEDIFEMYQVLNQPYTEELYKKVTKNNVMHKLTYKMDLQKMTEDGKLTLYGYLFKWVYTGSIKGKTEE